MAKDAASISIRLPDRAYDDLAAVTRNADKLDALSDRVAAAGVTSDVNTIVAEIAEDLDLPEAEARQLFYGLLNLQYLRSDLRMTGDQLIEVLIRTFDENAPPDWKDENLEKFVSMKSEIAKVLTPDSPLSIFQKAQELRYTHQNTLARARIITDVRPVFDDDADEILGAVVSHQLVVEYTEGGGKKRLHFAMDDSDVKQLKEQCQRAERKAATAGDALKVLWGAPQQGTR